MYRDLLEQARQLATLDPRRPRQVNLRRAVSAAYYALFHALVEETCQMMFGSHRDDTSYRHVLGRAFSHRTMYQAYAAFAGGTLKAAVTKGLPSTFVIPTEIKTLANTFGDAQERRHLADYDRTERFLRSEVQTLVQQVQTDLDAFLNLPPAIEKKFFLACLLTWNTLTSR